MVIYVYMVGKSGETYIITSLFFVFFSCSVLTCFPTTLKVPVRVSEIDESCVPGKIYVYKYIYIYDINIYI